MASKKRISSAEQSARFREAARKAGGDQRSFEIAFKKIVPVNPRKKPKMSDSSRTPQRSTPPR
jgi:hypothetical protein